MDNSSNKIYTTQLQPNEEWISIIDEFLSYSLNLIHDGRIKTKEIEPPNQKIKNKFSFSPVSNKIKTDKFYLHQSNTKEKSITLLIYFKRKGISLIIERWKFVILHSEQPKPVRMTFLKKKLFVLSRTMMSLIKILPAYSIFLQTGFDFSFDFDLKYGNETVEDKKDLFQSMHFTNYTDNMGSVKIEVRYLMKNVIFQLEDEMNKVFIKDSSTRRQRFLSGDSIDKYSKGSLTLERHDSHSADKMNPDIQSEEINLNSNKLRFNPKQESSYKTVETAGTSTGSVNSLIDKEIYNHMDDLSTKFASVKCIELRMKELNVLHEGDEDMCDYDSDDLAVSNYSSISRNSSDLELSIRADDDELDYEEVRPIEMEKIVTKMNLLRRYVNNNKIGINLVALFNKIQPTHK